MTSASRSGARDTSRNRSAAAHAAWARDRTDARDPQIHPLHDLVARWSAIAVAVALLVRRVEAIDGDGGARRDRRPRRAAPPHLPGLSEVAQVRTAAERISCRRSPRAASAARASASRRRTARRHRRSSRAIVALDERLHVVVLQVDREQPEGRHVARRGGISAARRCSRSTRRRPAGGPSRRRRRACSHAGRVRA